MAKICYLSIGSNLKSPQRQLQQAIAALRKLPTTAILKIASFYRNKAWGRKGQPDFYNTVVALSTTLTPAQLLTYCQQIEYAQGRIRKVKWASRTIDLDLIFYGKHKITSPRLIIPHPRWHLRDFVIFPLQEIMTIGEFKELLAHAHLAALTPLPLNQ